MRQIEFRGKRLDNGEWVYGYLFQIWERTYILWGTTNDVPNMIEVDPSTVGQFTGLFDKNEKKIYEFDVINSIDSDISGNVYGIDKIVLEDMTDFSLMASLNYANELEVIGNIFDKENE